MLKFFFTTSFKGKLADGFVSFHHIYSKTTWTITKHILVKHFIKAYHCGVNFCANIKALNLWVRCKQPTNILDTKWMNGLNLWLSMGSKNRIISFNKYLCFSVCFILVVRRGRYIIDCQLIKMNYSPIVVVTLNLFRRKI